MNIDYGSDHLLPDGLLPLVTAAGMRAADQATIDEIGIDGATLMESAGRACASVAQDMLEQLEGKRAAILCGKGNNGGDGLVIARQLVTAGYQVRVLMSGSADELSDDAAHQLRLLEKMAPLGAAQVDVRPAATASISAGDADLWIDALLGTGLTSELREPYQSLVGRLNELGAPVLSVDIPTGLNADTGAVLGQAVRADVTVTMAAVKSGMVLADGPGHCGHVVIAEIGVPKHLLRDVARSSGALLTTDEAARGWLPRRAHDANKYSAGMVMVVGGSLGMTGAPVMTARAASRAGAGYVMVACDEMVQPILAQKMTTVTSIALPSRKSGGLEASESIEAISGKLAKASAVVIGPGLGREGGTIDFVIELLRQIDIPAVIDADALFALSQRTEFLSANGRPDWILTPHEGEFSRLAGGDVELHDRIAVAREYARRWGCTIILKGLPSLAASPDGRVVVAATASSALATAGTGDVLAGLCGALCAQGITPLEAAAGALHLGGAAADDFSVSRSPLSMIATDLIRHIPRVLARRFDT